MFKFKSLPLFDLSIWYTVHVHESSQSRLNIFIDLVAVHNLQVNCTIDWTSIISQSCFKYNTNTSCSPIEFCWAIPFLLCCFCIVRINRRGILIQLDIFERREEL